MFRQVIGPHETFAALGTGEALFTRMRAQMTLQFIGTGECFATEEPMATKRTFARMPTKMRFQMRGFPIDLLADMTDMLTLGSGCVRED